MNGNIAPPDPPNAAAKPTLPTAKCFGMSLDTNTIAVGKSGPRKTPKKATETEETMREGTSQKTSSRKRLMAMYEMTALNSPILLVRNPRTARPNAIPNQKPVAVAFDWKDEADRTLDMYCTIQPPRDTRNVSLRLKRLRVHKPSAPTYPKTKAAKIQVILFLNAWTVRPDFSDSMIGNSVRYTKPLCPQNVLADERSSIPAAAIYETIRYRV
jgi:hypothetical protein